MRQQLSARPHSRRGNATTHPDRRATRTEPTSLPAGLPAKGGPSITSVVHVGSAILGATAQTVNIAHDKGTDLLLPGTAAAGTGWDVMDGYASGTATGTPIAVSSVTRASATILTLTLASPLTTGTVRVFYPFSNFRIEKGNAVTDNFAAQSRATGYDAGYDLAPGYIDNYSLAAPLYGVLVG